LLRNAVDHGIESKEVRQQKGKDPTGKIQLTFTQQGDQVSLILKDDGAGIDAENIYQKALKKGLIDSDTTLLEEEKLRLILLAGFSTRDKVTETSGRGVGMDVVNLAVQNLSGDIFIRSEKNKGSEIHIQVPLTLSVANVLLVDILGNTLAIPNAFIEQVYHLTGNNIEEKQGKLFINYQQQKLPLLALSTLLSWPASRFISDKSQSVLIVNHHNKRYALYADQILKPLNITIKTLKPWMINVIGVNGVCLLPNGVVAPVLNLFDLLRTSVQNALDIPLNITDSATININQNKILVVDDSLSNRIALRLMLEALGYEVGTAVDGADALQQIEKAPFKLVITDLEMPNMNGLEMVESLRVWAETKNLPIIMVTSRSTAKHRTLATQAGVNEYLTKPVDSNTLQATIEKYEMSINIKEG
jgi:chemosensory pili system protein ChpA (sensor histidine kinase/response regulator)